MACCSCTVGLVLVIHQTRLTKRALPAPDPALLLVYQVAEVFTGSPGKYVSLEDTISGFQGILDGKYDDLPEMAFYMVRTACQLCMQQMILCRGRHLGDSHRM